MNTKRIFKVPDDLLASAAFHLRQASDLRDLSTALPSELPKGRYLYVHATSSIMFADAIIGISVKNIEEALEVVNVFDLAPMVFRLTELPMFVPSARVTRLSGAGGNVQPVAIQITEGGTLPEFDETVTNFLFWYVLVPRGDGSSMSVIIFAGLDEPICNLDLNGYPIKAPEGHVVRYDNDGQIAIFIYWTPNDTEWESRLRNFQPEDSIWADIIM